MRDALAGLPVRAEDRTGYERTKFRHRIDADKDGCNTRAEVLQAEAVLAPEQGANCTLSGDRWYSPYDDRYLDGPRGLDIDHLVPLAQAWDSSADAWSASVQDAYANDLGDGRALIAVSAAANRPGPQHLAAASRWLPLPVTDWVADKTRWGLSVDTTEHSALCLAVMAQVSV